MNLKRHRYLLSRQIIMPMIFVLLTAAPLGFALWTHFAHRIELHADSTEAWNTKEMIDFCISQAPAENGLSKYLRNKFPSGSDESDLERALVNENFVLLPPCANDSSIHKAQFSTVWGKSPYFESIEVYSKIDQSNKIIWIKALALKKSVVLQKKA